MSNAPQWFTYLMEAELVFVACFAGAELGRLAFRSVIVSVERKTQVLSNEKYIVRIGVPLIATIAAPIMAMGVAYLTDASASDLTKYVGLLLIMTSVFVAAHYYIKFATDSWPRQVSRGQIRRRLAETRQQLAASHPSTAEFAALGRRLERTRTLADRLEARAADTDRLTAIRRERRWLIVAIGLAALFPLPFVVVVTLRLATGQQNPQRWAALGLLILLSCATLGAAEIRRFRHRVDMRDLAAELRDESMALLTLLKKMRPAGNPQFREGFAIDIIEYSRRREPIQRELQQRLVDLVQRIVTDSGITWAGAHHQLNGDGVIVFLPIGTNIPTMLRVIECAVAELARDNAAHAERMRWRMSMDVGVVELTAAGFSGHAAIALSRMLDSAPLRAAAKDNDPADLVLAMSDLLFDAAVGNEYSPSFTTRTFRKERAVVKEYRRTVWIWVPPPPRGVA